MKSSRKWDKLCSLSGRLFLHPLARRQRIRARRPLCAVIFILCFLAAAAATRAAMPRWLQNIESAGDLEKALYRLMSLPSGDVLARRPPGEARPLLDSLVKSQPKNSELYSLRALSEEQQLDFDSAERDWKLYSVAAADPLAAHFALADFYHRRLRPTDEINALEAIAHSAATPADALVPEPEQRSWRAFERIAAIIRAQALPPDLAAANYRAWIARYPENSSLYARFLDFDLAQKNYSAALELIAAYNKAFPSDTVFPLKARALVDYRQGNIERGLADYDQAFQPLWPAELVQSYFDLLTQTRSLRKFLDRSRAAWNANADDLSAAARVYFYYRQQNKFDAAAGVLSEFRLRKESRDAAWKPEELYTLARLSEDIGSVPEAARYYYALYNVPSASGASDNPERALAGLTALLLTSPDQPIRLGSGSLAMYRNVATLDPGPGFLNGILSLVLNSTEPQARFFEEEQRAFPYFHRARAAELLALLDQKFPSSARRAALHAQLLRVYANDGERDAIIRGGREFLQNFPNAPERTDVALLVADALARGNQTAEEFAVYDSLLKELSARAQNVPLGAAAAGYPGPATPDYGSDSAGHDESEAENDSGDEPFGEQEDAENMAGQVAEGQENLAQQQAQRRQATRRAFSVAANNTTQAAGPRSAEYSRVLERYLSRLVSKKQIRDALRVLRQEVDRNPNDPGLYERLALFLDQNHLDSELEDTYRRAIAQFPDRSWYHKLARWYLRRERQDTMAKLTEDVIKIFSGSELESYFRDVVGPVGPGLYLHLNLFAHERFPHNLAFVRNLLGAYRAGETYNPAAAEKLLREHWFEDEFLTSEYFELLSYSHRLDSELDAIRRSNPYAPGGHWPELVRDNPVAGQWIASAEIWRSHFEAAQPVLVALAAEYPADVSLGRKASAVCRSLAYFDPKETDAAVAIEKNLLAAAPTISDTLARIGDIYADRERFADAAPYWNRMAELRPGESGGYVDAATVFWDYYMFDDALRLLNQGRKNLAQPDLYRYEEGAICENKREYPRAIAEYVQGALAENMQGQASSRLLTLAMRPALRSVADSATAKAAGAGESFAAIRLRYEVLKAQKRKPDAEAFLMTAVDAASSIELVDEIAAFAQQESLDSVFRRGLEQQAVLTTDPVGRLELRYALVRFYEGKKDFAAAQRNIEALYKENPNILGVVRATVDFYWRMKMQQQAIDVLLAAAKVSYPALKTQFSFEAARKATDAGNTALARQLLEPLLADSPYNGEYLAAMADTYARSGDDQGLRQFYLAQIQNFRQAPLSSEDRTARIATLRRGLILALTHLKDYPGAVDQYIELINKYPEDESLTVEAALYAVRYSLQPKLAGFYAKTSADSPKDFRWPMVLGRLETQFEDYPAAIDAFSKSIAVRPDLVDLHVARADLQLRLLRFDEAISEYERLYDLTYHDGKWMQQIAETRARQGQTAAAVAALKTALIDGRPPEPANFFSAARLAESWGLLDPARDFAQQGVDLAGSELLAAPENLSGAQLYTRLLVRLRRAPATYTRLESALAASEQSPNSPSAIVNQVERQGIAAVTDKEWRQRIATQRAAAGRSDMQRCLVEMGAIVSRYYTPEEKSAFADFLSARDEARSPRDLADFLVPAAEAAGFADLEARWRKQLMLGDPLNSSGQMQRYIELQRDRLKFTELAADLETLAAALPPRRRAGPLEYAAWAYRSAGDSANELRVLGEYEAAGWLGHDDLEQRYFELLLAQRPQGLVEASRRGPRRDQAANFVLAHGEFRLAAEALAARGEGLPPVWSKAYLGLAGLYFFDTTAEVDAAFRDSLDESTIGERLGKPVDRAQKLAGDIWFYYGSRYGEYLGGQHKPNIEDYLPAVLERSPGRAAAYLVTAEYYADSGDAERAIADYNRSLDLSADNVDVLNRIAALYWSANQRAEAIAQWKKSLAVLRKETSRRFVPPDFQKDFSATMGSLGQRHLLRDLRPDVDAVLRSYLRSGSTYQAGPLLGAAYRALDDPAAGTAWMLDLVTVSPTEPELLEQLTNTRSFPRSDQEIIYARLLDRKRRQVEKSEGFARETAQRNFDQWQVRWVTYLVNARRYDRAQTALDALSEETRNAQVSDLVPLELRVAAATNKLDAKLDSYRADPSRLPDASFLRSAAAALQKSGDKGSARKILEFVFSREIEQHQLTAANFLGLAEIRLDSGDLPGAVDLLRRMSLVVGEPFANLDSAAALLEKTSHPAEAATFLDQLVRAVPWSPGDRLRFATACIVAGTNASACAGGANPQSALASIAASSESMYELRVQAAGALAAAKVSADPGSAELRLLASAAPFDAAKANQPFFYDARLKAAQRATDNTARIALLRAALEDSPHRDDARISLFRAAFAAQQYQLAHADVLPLMTGGFLQRSRTPRPAPVEQEDASEDQNDAQLPAAEESEVQARPAAPDLLAKIPRAERAAIAADYATVLERLNLPNVSQYVEIAIRFEPSAARRTALRSRLASIRAALKREAANAERRPMVHDALEQDRTVRPRLAAPPVEKNSSAPGKTAKPPAKKSPAARSAS